MDGIFSENLPRQNGFGANKDKLLVDWKKSIGYNLDFEYNGLKGVFNITDYIPKLQNVILSYNSKEYIVKTINILNSNLDIIFNPKRVYKFRYKINDIMLTGSSNIKILEQINIKQNNGIFIKSYKYECLNCGNIDITSESNMLKNSGCNVCCTPCKKILKGYNDIATTNPQLIKYFANVEDVYKYSYASNQRVLIKCPECNQTKIMQISNLYNQGFNCDKCGDGVSYPEKIMFNVLCQTNIEFNFQKTMDWSNRLRYDFYIEDELITIIIETHGEQHYRHTGRGKPLIEEIENDRIKKELALDNGIKEENYIVIDCSKSELEFIKDNILKSRLNILFDLSDIDWLKCHEYACSNLVKVACDLWNNGFKSTIKIAETLKMDRHTILRYLKQGSLIKWCDYDLATAEINRLENSKNKRSRKVRCITLNKTYGSSAEAEREFGIVGIYECLSGKRKTFGKLKDGTRLEWEYAE